MHMQVFSKRMDSESFEEEGDCNFLIVFCKHLQTTKSGLHILLSGAHFATFASVARLRSLSNTSRFRPRKCV